MSENTISRRTFFWNAAIIGFRDNTLLIFLYRTFNMRIFRLDILNWSFKLVKVKLASNDSLLSFIFKGYHSIRTKESLRRTNGQYCLDHGLSWEIQRWWQATACWWTFIGEMLRQCSLFLKWLHWLFRTGTPQEIICILLQWINKWKCLVKLLLISTFNRLGRRKSFFLNFTTDPRTTEAFTQMQNVKCVIIPLYYQLKLRKTSS